MAIKILIRPTRGEKFEETMWGGNPLPFLLSPGHMSNFTLEHKPDIKSFCSRPLPRQHLRKLGNFQKSSDLQSSGS